MHNAPIIPTLFQCGSAQATALDVPSSEVGGDRILERGPSSVTGNFHADVGKCVFRVLHLFHFGPEMMVPIVGPSVICVAAFEHSDGFIIGPQLLHCRHVATFESCRALREHIANGICGVLLAWLGLTPTVPNKVTAKATSIDGRIHLAKGCVIESPSE